MLIKVYNKETTNIETIDVKNLDIKKHFHRNTHAPLTEFITKVETKKETPKKVETK